MTVGVNHAVEISKPHRADLLTVQAEAFWKKWSVRLAADGVRFYWRIGTVLYVPNVSVRTPRLTTVVIPRRSDVAGVKYMYNILTTHHKSDGYAKLMVVEHREQLSH